jgi:hypothetical protein
MKHPDSTKQTISVKIPSEMELLDKLIQLTNIDPAKGEEYKTQLMEGKDLDEELSIKALEHLFSQNQDISKFLGDTDLILRPVSWKSIALAISSDDSVGASGKGEVQKGKTMGRGPFAGFIPGAGQQGIGKAGDENDPEKIKLYNGFVEHRYEDSQNQFKQAVEIIQSSTKPLSEEAIKKCNILLDHYNFDVNAQTNNGEEVFVFLDKNGQALKDDKGVTIYATKAYNNYERVNNDHSSGALIEQTHGFMPKQLKLCATKDMCVDADGNIRDKSSNEIVQYDLDHNLKLSSTEKIKLSSGDIDMVGKITKVEVPKIHRLERSHTQSTLIADKQAEYAEGINQKHLLKLYREHKKDVLEYIENPDKFKKLAEEKNALLDFYDKHETEIKRLQKLLKSKKVLDKVELIKKCTEMECTPQYIEQVLNAVIPRTLSRELLRESHEYEPSNSKSPKTFVAAIQGFIDIEKEYEHAKSLGAGSEEELKQGGMVQTLMDATKDTGMFRHGPESANYFIPQKNDSYLYHASRNAEGKIEVKKISGGELGYLEYINSLEGVDANSAINPSWGWQKTADGKYEISSERVNIAGVNLNHKGTDEKDIDAQNILKLAYNYNKAIFENTDIVDNKSDSAGLSSKKNFLFIAEQKYRKKHKTPSPVFQISSNEQLNKDFEKYKSLQESKQSLEMPQEHMKVLIRSLSDQSISTLPPIPTPQTKRSNSLS